MNHCTVKYNTYVVAMKHVALSLGFMLCSVALKLVAPSVTSVSGRAYMVKGAQFYSIPKIAAHPYVKKNLRIHHLSILRWEIISVAFR